MDRRLLLSFPYLTWLLLLVVAPFGLVIATSLAERDSLGGIHFGFSLKAFSDLIDPLYAQILARSLGFAGLCTFLIIALATPVAFYLSRIRRSQAAFYLVLFLIPFWTNFLIRLLSFMDVLRLQPFGLQWNFTFHGMVAAMVYNMLPFAVFPLYAAFEKIPNSLIEAAFDLGASKRWVLLKLLWPLTKGAIYIVSLIVFIPTMGEFLIPELVGGGHSFYLGTFLHQQFLISRNWPLGAAAVVVLFSAALILVTFAGKALDRNS